VAHLYRRAGFGATPAELRSLQKQSWSSLVGDLLAGLSRPDHGASKAQLPHLTSVPESNVPGYRWDGYGEFVDLVTWWVQRMILTETPLREKLALLLHCQFPTSWEKVGWAYMMYVQNQLFRNLGPGRFDTLTRAVAKDPAMLIWLDTGTDHKRVPNENFARELMERFTMGAGTFSEHDVRESARSFTGWQLDNLTGEFYENPYDHDNGVKHLLHHAGRFDGDDIVGIVTGTEASHRWVPARIWSWLAYPVVPSDPIVTELAAVYSKHLDMTALLSSILHHPQFTGTTAQQGLIKQPIEYVVGTMKLLNLTAAALPSGDLFNFLQSCGQLLFAPPSVGGWGQNEYWLSTSNSNTYLGFANYITQYADLTDVANLNGQPSAQVHQVRQMLGIASLSNQSYAAMMKLATGLKSDSGTWPARQLMSLALVSPEFLVN
jgi:uncharacterized protein (DUF1800 family)